ncbi:NUDIX hydrolase [Tetragenococcus koreensis]|uniref:NUDIX family hydrolase n=1 Tax=Tetragenococcus koreensis TaxID=290335 RepID=A0AAN4UAC5_9ENTE|nr:NUDIX hydrolase [Tetragenococcus koreensis]MDN6292024.1 NUDIX hydrolase [Tetragenococcus halophilus]AYW44911.1 DNA mismatch repair protein MutT [Tetragenococcus koreensis]MCF1584589.1 NUDIX hydrolase [Tetragenococcus koreensis]MCF1614141.1 NUDIX hydrolase [Tetragenococcus koreensis]MCF1617379.1 NUDIX hydrolase [Tetragenococcus koreensis]
MDYLATYKELLSIAQAGLHYGNDKFDRFRYQELNDLALQLLQSLGDEPQEVINDLFSHESGYQTPKVDVRAWITQENKILLVQDSKTQEWSLPGGYADVGSSPKENVRNEVYEETGLTVDVRQLKAVFDTNLRKDIPQAFQYYKLVFDCEILSGSFTENMETSQMDYFAMDNLPILSKKRTTKEQLVQLMQQDGPCNFE